MFCLSEQVVFDVYALNQIEKKQRGGTSPGEYLFKTQQQTNGCINSEFRLSTVHADQKVTWQYLFLQQLRSYLSYVKVWHTFEARPLPLMMISANNMYLLFNRAEQTLNII